MINVEAKGTVNILDLNITDLLLLDHRCIRKCFDKVGQSHLSRLLLTEKVKEFVIQVQLYLKLEQLAVYSFIKDQDQMQEIVEEGLRMHLRIEEKIKKCIKKISYSKKGLIREVTELNLLLLEYFQNEKEILLSKIQTELRPNVLEKMGKCYMGIRKFSITDLENYPTEFEQMYDWKDSTQKISSHILVQTENQNEGQCH